MKNIVQKTKKLACIITFACLPFFGFSQQQVIPDAQFSTKDDNPVGIADNSSTNGFSNIKLISNQQTLEVSFTKSCDPAVISIFDLTGKMIYSESISKNETEVKKCFDMTTQPKAIFIVCITNNKNQKHTQKCIL